MGFPQDSPIINHRMHSCFSDNFNLQELIMSLYQLLFVRAVNLSASLSAFMDRITKSIYFCCKYPLNFLEIKGCQTKIKPLRWLRLKENL